MVTSLMLENSLGSSNPVPPITPISACIHLVLGVWLIKIATTSYALLAK
jgi:hypothetical protein